MFSFSKVYFFFIDSSRGSCFCRLPNRKGYIGSHWTFRVVPSDLLLSVGPLKTILGLRRTNTNTRTQEHRNAEIHTHTHTHTNTHMSIIHRQPHTHTHRHTDTQTHAVLVDKNSYGARVGMMPIGCRWRRLCSLKVLTGVCAMCLCVGVVVEI